MNMQSLIYVVDSSDIERLEESKKEFWTVIKNKDLEGCSVLIFANKQDVTNAKSTNDLIKIFDLEKLNSHKWHVQGSSATSGNGLTQGLDWMANSLDKKTLEKMKKSKSQLSLK